MARSSASRPTRRLFLKTSAAASALAAGWLPGPRTGLAAPSSVDLTAGPARVSLVGEGYPETLVWAFDGQVPGPVIRAVQGERLTITVTNELAEPTAVHWHGLRVPVGMDGVPYLSQPPIEPGETFTYAFDLPDAGTYWYHPHINSSEQVGRELLCVLDDWRLEQDAGIAPFGNMHDASHNGRIGNSATINGEILERLEVSAGERIRLRLINAANARTFGLRFRDLDPWIVGLDGHPVDPRRLGDRSLALDTEILGQRPRRHEVLFLGSAPSSVREDLVSA